jgi:hypothetical protein
LGQKEKKRAGLKNKKTKKPVVVNRLLAGAHQGIILCQAG